jgi:hypothetical protein
VLKMNMTNHIETTQLNNYYDGYYG